MGRGKLGVYKGVSPKSGKHIIALDDGEKCTLDTTDEFAEATSEAAPAAEPEEEKNEEPADDDADDLALSADKNTKSEDAGPKREAAMGRAAARAEFKGGRRREKKKAWQEDESGSSSNEGVTMEDIEKWRESE